MVEPSKTLQAVFDKVVKDAIKLRHEYVTLEHLLYACLLYTSPSPRDVEESRMPASA